MSNSSAVPQRSRVQSPHRPRACAFVVRLAVGLGLLTMLSVTSEAADQPYTFGTLAGLSLTGSDDGPGSIARFKFPWGLAVDTAGTVYVADRDNHTIRKIAPDGTVSTLAGLPGSAGSGDGTGSAARFWSPAGVAVDTSGNVYVADSQNHTIRAITPAGDVSTLAGSPFSAGSDDGVGSAALFTYPEGVAVDAAGIVYVADTGNHTIRMIATDGTVTTLAGAAGEVDSTDGIGCAARFSSPAGVAVDTAGIVYVADRGNHTIRMIALDGTVSTWAGIAGQGGSDDGPRSFAHFFEPTAVAVDAAGNVYVVDSIASIRKITADDGTVSTLAGMAGQTGSADGPGAAARFMYPLGIAADGAGQLYVSDTQNSAVRKITTAGVVSTWAGPAGSGGSADGFRAAARFTFPYDVAVDAAGTLYVADANNQTIRKITPDGTVSTLAGLARSVGSTGGTGSAARFWSPTGLAVNATGTVYVADTGTNIIRAITPDGTVTTLAGLAGTTGSADGTGSAARFSRPTRVAVDPAGTVYVSDTGNHTIRKITPAGTVSTLAGLATVSGSADGTGSAARFQGPQGLASDTAGNLYVADSYNFTIRVITPAGAVSTLAGTAGAPGTTDATGSAARFAFPWEVAVDAAGRVFVADYTTIRMITPARTVSTLAGLANVDGSTDGTGSAARFSGSLGIAVDSAGNLYVADSYNNTIRKGVAGNPGIIAPPTGQTVTAGTNATFTALVSGTPAPVSQWQISTDAGTTWSDLMDAAPYSGVMTAALTITSVAGTSNGNRYRIVATSSAGTTASSGATLTVDFPPAIITQPANQTVAAGSNASFTVAATGNPLPTFQWQMSTSGGATWSDLANTTPYSGATTATLTITTVTVGLTGNQYRAIATNSLDSATTSSATLTVVVAPAITGQPVNQTVTAGSNASFTGTASGIPPPNYRWQISNDSGTTWSDLTNTAPYSGTTTATLTITSVSAELNDHRYRVVATNSASSATSSAATLTVNAAPEITTQPANQTVRPGSNASFTVSASGNPPPTYQWQISINNGTAWSDLTNTPPYTGVTTATLAIASVPATLIGLKYRAIAANSLGSAATSPATLTVRTTPLDMDRDGKADLVIFRPSDGNWFIRNSSTDYTTSSVRQWGLTGDVPVPGDYDGDGQMDPAVYRPSTGGWYVLRSGTDSPVTYSIGPGRDLAVPGDYDGDGRTDPAVYHRSTGVWSILTSSTNHAIVATWQWGLRGDIPVPRDYDGDGKTDLAVYRPSLGTWYVLTSSSGSTASFSLQWGVPGDVPVPGDYDGDGITDVAVFRPATGMWLILRSATGFTTSASFQFGLSADVPVLGDYDGDGLTDVGVYRPALGTWFIRQSSTGYAMSVSFAWGLSGDIPLPGTPGANAARAGDFDGDRRADLTLYRPSLGAWLSLRSSANYLAATLVTNGAGPDLPVPGDFDGDGRIDEAVFTPATGIWSILRSSLGLLTSQWGLNGDVPVPGDYDGDGVTDLAVYRPASGTWFLRESSSNGAAASTLQWGLNGDIPVPGDYDGDGIMDVAAWRPSTGTWFIRQSSTGYATSVSWQWGINGDVPVPGDYDGDGVTDLAVWRPANGTWFIRTSSTGYAASLSLQWGLSADTPTPADFDGDGKTDLTVWRPSTGVWHILKSSSNFTVSDAMQWGLPGDRPIPGRR